MCQDFCYSRRLTWNTWLHATRSFLHEALFCTMCTPSLLVFDRTGNELFGVVPSGISNSRAITAHSPQDIRTRSRSFPPGKGFLTKNSHIELFSQVISYGHSKREGGFPHYCLYFITSLQHLVHLRRYTSDSARADL